MMNEFDNENMKTQVSESAAPEESMEVLFENHVRANEMETILANTFFHKLMDSLEIGMITANADFTITFATPFIASILKTKPERLIGQSLYNILTPDDLVEAAECGDDLINGKIVKKCCRFVSATGALVKAAVTALPIPIQEKEARQLLFLIHTDFEDNQNNGFREKLYEESPEMIGILDFSGFFRDVNRATADLLGWTQKDLTSHQVQEFIHVEDQNAYLNAFLAGRNGSMPAPIQVRFQSKSGTYKWVEWILKPDMENKILYSIGRDISEHKHLEALRNTEIKKQTEAHKLESLQVMAGGIAHDFNNLLTVILGHTNLLLLEMNNETTAYESVTTIQDSALRAAELSHQMLAYAGEGPHKFQPIDPSELVRRFKTDLERRVKEPIAIEFDLAKELGTINVNLMQIGQALEQLVKNAAQSMDSNSGLISISTRPVTLAHEDLQDVFPVFGVKAGNYIGIEVRDTGPGIDPHSKDRIFDPFFSTRPSCRGLGLAIAMGLVRIHRGAIRVETGSNGTSMTILLPSMKRLDSRPVTTSTSEKPFIDQWRGSGTILVADDLSVMRDIAKTLLQSRGFDVITAMDGREAVELFEHQMDRIKLVVLDRTMPYMNGLEAFEKIRALRPNMHIIISSGYDETSIPKSIRNSRRTRFLKKPFTGTKLIYAVKNFLDPGPSNDM